MTIPLFQHERATIYCGDAYEVVPTLDEYQLLLTDPPYGNGYQSNDRTILGKFDGIVGDNDLDKIKKILGVAWRKLKINRHGYVFGPTTPKDALPNEVGGTTELIWNKSSMSGGDLTAPWGQSHETIWFGVKRYTGKRAANTGNMSARLRRGTVININRVGETGRSHPTQKPIALLSQLIEMSSNPGDVILDPFMGSGSSCVASILEGRKTIGIEIDSIYCEEALKEIKLAIKFRENLESEFK